MDNNYSHMVSDLFGQRWFWFVLVGSFLFFGYGVWIFSTPKYEIMYTHRTLPEVRFEKSFMHCHIVEIGNTGREPQKSVNVIFSTDAMKAAALKPKATNFGKVNRKTENRETGDTTMICLGSIKPEMRVEIQLLYIYQTGEIPLRWDEIFKGVKTAEGAAVEGDPGWTILGRMLYAVFG